jgi:hypothetical protein
VDLIEEVFAQQEGKPALGVGSRRRTGATAVIRQRQRSRDQRFLRRSRGGRTGEERAESES